MIWLERTLIYPFFIRSIDVDQSGARSIAGVAHCQGARPFIHAGSQSVPPGQWPIRRRL